MTDLFGDGPPAGSRLFQHQQVLGHPPPQARARHTDPETSHEAARSVTKIRESQLAVLNIIIDWGPMTDEQIALRAEQVGLTQSPSGLRTRRSELVALDLVKHVGFSRTRANRRTRRWEVIAR